MMERVVEDGQGLVPHHPDEEDLQGIREADRDHLHLDADPGPDRDPGPTLLRLRASSDSAVLRKPSCNVYLFII